jgi:phosphoglycolate phosphatase
MVQVIPGFEAHGSKPKAVIWDWNGTLLNDTGICVSAMNTLLRERQLPEIDIDTYQNVFTFPVKDYYQAIGFDFAKEAFEVPALAFMDLYIERIIGASLHQDARTVMELLKEKGIRQFMLSAMEQQLLERLLTHFDLHPFLETALGIEDHLGGGKTHRGKQLLSEMQVEAHDCLFVGDTLHDKEVAQAIGCPFVLLSIGHQSAARLQADGNRVLGSLTEVASLF